MYANNVHNIQDDLNRLHISNVVPQQYSPGGGRKVAPVVPPKPKKSGLEAEPGQALYSNVGSSSRSGLQDYCAVNAPTPGVVGVASARINRAYTGHQDGMESEVPSYQPLTRGHVESPTPGGYAAVAHSSSHQVYANTPPPSLTSYTPPPPQPAHSYTPTSRQAVHMGAPQPLYSNTASQPVYDNSPRGMTRTSQSYVRSGLCSPAQSLTHGPTYANMSMVATNGSAQHYANVEAMQGAPNYATYGVDEDFPPPPDEGPPPSPPSPVSSSYSELRHATTHEGHHQKLPQGGKYATYAPASHTSSTYESIYEPLSPRPGSQLSNKSVGYSSHPYGPYTSPHARGLAPAPSPQPILNPDKVGKEAEVDALTNVLVKSMGSSNDPEFFGICARCGDRVVGEGTGCTAMEQVFHIKCFYCVVCLLRLQGKPFYALDSKPYCEDCYLNTLEKCCVCTKPILERILRATGKPYHPGCFTCVVCHKSLDGIPFTVDASNQIHCIDDFHKKFAPRCSVCKEPIMPEQGQDETVRVVALDRSFHVNCYKCEDCGLVLSSEAEGRGCYPLDGHVLCKSCNARRVQAITSKVTTEL